MKKVISIAIIAIMAISMLSLSAFAAGGINNDEQRILDAVGGSFVVCGEEITLDATWINQSKNYCLRDDVDITAAQADEIIGYIEQAKAVASSSKEVSVAKAFTTDINKQIIALADKAARVLGLTCYVSSDRKTVVFKALDTGDIVFQTTKTIKDTGASEAVLPVVAVSLLFVMAATGAVCVKKFEL